MDSLGGKREIGGRRFERDVALASAVERRLRDPGLAAHLRDRRSFLRLAQDEGDLRIRALRLLIIRLRLTAPS